MIGHVIYAGLLSCGLVNAAVPIDPAAAPVRARQIIRWPGGWMDLAEPGVIHHDGSERKDASTVVVVNSANGVGNTIVIDNGGSKGATVLHNVKNGVGNSVTVTPKGPVFNPKAETSRPVQGEKK